MRFGFNSQTVVYVGYMSSSYTLPVNNEADDDSDHSLDDGSGEDGGINQDEEDDYQNTGTVE